MVRSFNRLKVVALALAVTSLLTGVLADCAPDEFSSTDAGSGPDALPADGARPDAVGPDASVPPADGGFAFTDPCTTQHKLCCNFDDAALDKCWASLSASNATLDLADAVAVSPPLSMHALAQGDASYGYGPALLGGGQSVVCTFDLYIDKLIGNDHNLGQIVVNGDDNHGFSIVSSPVTPDSGPAVARTRLFGRGPAGTQIFSTRSLDLPFRTWMRLQMSSAFPASGTGTGTFTPLSLDAGAAIEFPTDDTANTAFGFRAGALFVSTGSAGVYVDNVVCDTKP